MNVMWNCTNYKFITIFKIKISLKTYDLPCVTMSIIIYYFSSALLLKAILLLRII